MQLDFKLNAPITVSELTARIKELLEAGFADVWVQGEITNLRIPASGHIYFSLKDKDAQIRAVFFRQSSRAMRFRPEDGLEVIVRGRLSVYDARGDYQIIAEHMEPVGLGALQLAFLQLKERLEKEGLFAPGRKRPIPAHPKTVGVVTSTSGAAIRDVLKVLGRRAPGVGVVIAPSLVQGEGAPDEIAAGVAGLNALGGIDVIIVARGGGSMEDLAAFNTETVARAIAGSKVPVISAVGHETDFTIADFAADLRAPTPSAAAEVVAQSRETLRATTASLRSRLAFAAGQLLSRLRFRLDSERRVLGDPRRMVEERMLRLDDLSARLRRAASATLSSFAARLEIAGVAISSLAPLGPLARGFALVRRLPGLEVTRSASALAPGDRLRLIFHDGEADCRVEPRNP